MKIKHQTLWRTRAHHTRHAFAEAYRNACKIHCARAAVSCVRGTEIGYGHGVRGVALSGCIVGKTNVTCVGAQVLTNNRSLHDRTVFTRYIRIYQSKRRKMFKKKNRQCGRRVLGISCLWRRIHTGSTMVKYCFQNQSGS